MAAVAVHSDMGYYGYQVQLVFNSRLDPRSERFNLVLTIPTNIFAYLFPFRRASTINPAKFFFSCSITNVKRKCIKRKYKTRFMMKRDNEMEKEKEGIRDIKAEASMHRCRG